jgi:hypothetical protein
MAEGPRRCDLVSPLEAPEALAEVTGRERKKEGKAWVMKEGYLKMAVVS